MNNRRHFLKKLSFGLASPFLLNSTFSSKDEPKYIHQNLQGDDFWNKVRQAFPLTHNRVYLNNGTFGPSPTPVLEVLKKSLEHTNGTGEYGHTDEARAEIARFVNTKTSEISLTHNTTEGINIMAWGLQLNEGDEVILTLHEHVGNALPWLNRAKLHNIKLKTFEPADTKQENLDRIEALITPKTRVIAVPHITCTTGLVFPIKEISRLAKKHGIFTAIDGAHGAGTMNLDMHDLGCDFYATCCHKWMLGPGGTGFLYVKEDLLDTLQVYHVGAYSDTGWDLYSSPPALQGYVPTAHRYDYGTQSTPLYKGAAAAAKFHTEIGKERVEARLRELNEYLYNGLNELSNSLEILTPAEPESRISMVTFKPHKKEYRAFAQAVSKQGFRIRVVPESHLDALRISTHIYNSKEEVERFVAMVAALLG